MQYFDKSLEIRHPWRLVSVQQLHYSLLMRVLYNKLLGLHLLGKVHCAAQVWLTTVWRHSRPAGKAQDWRCDCAGVRKFPDSHTPGTRLVCSVAQ